MTRLEFRDQLLVFLDSGLGARQGKLGALRWMDCNFNELVFEVQHSYYWRRGGHLIDTKSEASAQPLPMHPRTPTESVAWGRPLYALTRICAVEYTKRVESVFEIIAEPNRRAILSLLVSSQQSVGEIERQLRMPQPTVSKHLRVLREAGFVESTVDAQRRLYRLKPEPFQEVDAWLAPFRRFWSAHVDALERHLDRMEQSTPSKRKTRKRGRGPNRDRDKGETK